MILRLDTVVGRDTLALAASEGVDRFEAHRYLLPGLLTCLAAIMAGGAWIACRAFSISVQGENALHAVNLVTVVIDKYVDDTGKWPTSWGELATVSSVNHWGTYSWPEDLEKVQRYVAVDFDADPARLAKQGVHEFDAIKPIGPCYPYKHYGFVAALLETLRKNTNGQHEHAR